MEQGSSPLEDFPATVFSVTPYTPSTADIQVSDDDKAGATLLFSGIFLGLVGITFTVMGWIQHQGVSHFEWTQLLGPILLSVGVTFILIAVCKFKMLSCQLCKGSEERVLDSEQMAGGQSFVFTGINQPITFHGATVVQYIPPPYGSQEPLGMNTAHLQPGVSPCCLAPSGVVAAAPPSPPQYYTIYPSDNPAFVGDQDYPSFVDGGNDRYGVCGGRPPLPAVTVTVCVCLVAKEGGGQTPLSRWPLARSAALALGVVLGALMVCVVRSLFRSSPDAERLAAAQLGDEDSACFSPPPYEEIFSLPH